MTKAKRHELLVKRIKRGIVKSYESFLEEAIRNNEKLVITRGGKVVLVPAREIKLK